MTIWFYLALLGIIATITFSSVIIHDYLTYLDLQKRLEEEQSKKEVIVL